MAKRHAPATLRNREAIAGILGKELPTSGTVLEVASGSGEHAVFFASQFSDHIWQPSDQDPEAIASIGAYRKECGLENVLPAIHLDATATWPIIECDAILCCNMIHISPWIATEGLLRNAGALLGEGAPLVLYGPFLEHDVPTAPSNLDFDNSLRARNPQWGIRSVSDVDELAAAQGFVRAARYAMPANNLMVIYRK